MAMTGVQRVGPYEWEVPLGYIPRMRVPGRFFLSEELAGTLEEGAINQLANVATLPGIRTYALAMPDIHWGYGFPIGGVAAFGMDDGIISPGGVGFDINCGVRLFTTPLNEDTLVKRRDLIERLYHEVPTGVGARSTLRLSGKALEDIMVNGSHWAVDNGYGTGDDLVRCEENGRMKDAGPEHVSSKARARGMPQSGTLGAGNHFLEIQVVKEIIDQSAAKAFRISQGQICVMIHCGSRGLGHQVCTDHLKVLEEATRKYGITLPDRQLACAPIGSPEGRAYFAGMAAAANYAWANRQVITHSARKVFSAMYGIAYEEMPLVYDVCHNVAKIETHEVGAVKALVCVHRKGATRAFGPGERDVPSVYRDTGQPVIIPGSMGTSSFLLAGTRVAMEKSFGSTCHGAGRVLSRAAAKRQISGQKVRNDLGKGGVIVRAPNDSSIAEEAPAAYKPSHEVVRVVSEAGLSRIVARLEPLGVIKG